MLKPNEDAYGREMMDWLKGQGSNEIIERDDGYIDVGQQGLAIYFLPFNKWPKYERQALRFAIGRVLDIGCGPGRCAIYLQEKGHDVLGIDLSPMAIKVAKKRGLKHTKVMSITQISKRLGIFDTILMYGNNFGLFGNHDRCKRLLKRFHKMTSDNARIIAESGNPYKTKEPAHLWYHKQNFQKGRMGGQVRIRVRYKKMKTPYFDYLLVSPNEMKDLLKGTGWKLSKIFDSGTFPYTVVIEKE